MLATAAPMAATLAIIVVDGSGVDPAKERHGVAGAIERGERATEPDNAVGANDIVPNPARMIKRHHIAGSAGEIAGIPAMALVNSTTPLEPITLSHAPPLTVACALVG